MSQTSNFLGKVFSSVAKWALFIGGWVVWFVAFRPVESNVKMTLWAIWGYPILLLIGEKLRKLWREAQEEPKR